MTETEKKALALVNEVTPYECVNTSDACHNHILKALYRAIEQHEAFKREVSDAVEKYLGHQSPWPDTSLRRFIIAKPDPLVEALGELADRNMEAEQAAETLRAAIEARGGRIVWEGE